MSAIVSRAKGFAEVITFSTADYRRAMVALGMKTIRLKFDRFTSFSWENIPQDFLDENHETVSLSRGAGYWIWKPFIISEVAKEKENNSLLLYCDSNVLPLKPRESFEKLATDMKIHVWAYEKSTILEWTHSTTLKKLEVSTEESSQNLIYAGAIFSKNMHLMYQFSKLWLDFCKDSNLLRPDSFKRNDTKEHSSYVWHRHDQSLLSIIVVRHPDWFTVHSPNLDNILEQHYFDVHRNKSIPILFGCFSFPRMRQLRRNIMSFFPLSIRYWARTLLFALTRKKISYEEVLAIKNKLRY